MPNTKENSRKIGEIIEQIKPKNLVTNPRTVGRGGFAMSKTAIVSLVKVEATLQKAKSNTFFLG